MNEEAIAAIRVVGAVARADGKISEEEKLAFRQTIAEFNPGLPEGVNVEQLLSDDVDLDGELAKITSTIIRKAVYDAAIGMALVDGTASGEENEILKRIRTAFGTIESKNGSLLDRALTDQRKLSQATPILDPTERRQRVQSIIAARALWSGIFGAIPIPLVSDIGVLINIDGLISSVAMTWGHPLTRKERLARFGMIISVAAATGAVHSLLKLIPGWGSTAGAVGGALSGYTVTFAIGAVVNYHFEKEGKTTPAELKKVFFEHKAAGKAAFEKNKDAIKAAGDEHAQEIADLTAQLDANKITVDEYDAKIGALIGPAKS